MYVALVPALISHPAFHRLQYKKTFFRTASDEKLDTFFRTASNEKLDTFFRTASDEKLDESLGPRLTCMHIWHTMFSRCLYPSELLFERVGVGPVQLKL